MASAPVSRLTPALSRASGVGESWWGAGLGPTGKEGRAAVTRLR